MGAFETLVELLEVHPQLPGRVPLTIRGTSSGGKVPPRTEEVVAALRLMAGISGGAYIKSTLHWGIMGGGRG